MLNGSTHSYDSSLADSPPPHHSTPNNLSVNSNGTMSGSYTDNSGNFLSQSRDDKETSPTPSSANSSVNASKPKKQTLPWMAELKQTQDKKRGLVTPGATNSPIAQSGVSPSLSTNNSPNVTTPSPHTQPPSTATKAPPLPAKPSTLGSVSGGQDKTYNNLNHSNSFGSSNKAFIKKSSPAPPMSNVPVNHNNADSHHRGDGDGNANKGYITYEEHAALKTKVISLENEVEILKRQVKQLMDRDLRGHIV